MACAVELVEQHSRAACTAGTSYGCASDTAVWTSCRGRFRCAGGPEFACGYPPGQPRYSCRCDGADDWLVASTRPRGARHSGARVAVCLFGQIRDHFAGGERSVHAQMRSTILNATALGDASTALQPACSLLAAGVRALNLTLDLQRVAVTAAAGDLEQDIDEVIDHLSQLITGAFTPVIPEAMAGSDWKSVLIAREPAPGILKVLTLNCCFQHDFTLTRAQWLWMANLLFFAAHLTLGILVVEEIEEPSEAEEEPSMDDKTRTEVEAAAFRGLIKHLQKRTDVQNIDLMNLGGFCRNCLSRWYMEAANERGIDMGKEEAREIFYGMPYEDWKAQSQSEASPEQKAAFEKSFRENVGDKG